MVGDWNDKAKKASSRVVAASKSHEDETIVCEPSPSAPACVCGVALRRQGGGVEGGAAACGRVGTSLTRRTPVAPLVGCVWRCGAHAVAVGTTHKHTHHTHHGVHNIWRGWTDGSMLIDDKMETNTFGGLMWVMKKGESWAHCGWFQREIFCLQSRCQYFNTSRQRDEETKERKKGTHLFKQFHESTWFIITRIRRERTMTCAHTKQETHTAGKRDCLFWVFRRWHRVVHSTL